MSTSKQKELEQLLDDAARRIRIALELNNSISNDEFEEVVFKGLKKVAENTSFHGKIERTQERAFPDIVIDSIYGVEVKKTTKKEPVITGNSIFETTRADHVKCIYIMLAYDAITAPKVKWQKYESAITNINVTHSPRYKLDLSASKETLFDKLEISYEKFQQLSRERKMKLVREHYVQKGNDKLWWLHEQDKPIQYRHFADLSKEEKEKLIGECYFLCPEVFSNSNDKFESVATYMLSKRIISHNVRDYFTSGGKVDMLGARFPQIAYKACTHMPNIINAINCIDDDLLSIFWKESPPSLPQDRFEKWLEKVKKEYKGKGDIEQALQEAFDTVLP